MSEARTTIDAACWRVPLEREVSVSALIGPAGGTLVMPQTGLRLVVPADAVDAPTTFRVTARARRIAAYDFEPDGSAFTFPLRVEQDPTLLAPPPRIADRAARMQLGYYADADVIDEARCVATVSEVHQLLEPVDPNGPGAFAVPHFSEYVVGWALR